MRQLIRFFFLLAAAAGLASAQCYSFTAPGVTYTMNISGLTTVQNSSVLSNWIVQQQSTLTVGGTIFTGPPGVPGNISIEDSGGETIYQSAAAQLLTIPTWQVNINLIGMIDYLPKSPTASLPRLVPGRCNRRSSNIRSGVAPPSSSPLQGSAPARQVVAAPAVFPGRHLAIHPRSSGARSVESCPIRFSSEPATCSSVKPTTAPPGQILSLLSAITTA